MYVVQGTWPGKTLGTKLMRHENPEIPFLYHHIGRLVFLGYEDVFWRCYTLGKPHQYYTGWFVHAHRHLGTQVGFFIACDTDFWNPGFGEVGISRGEFGWALFQHTSRVHVGRMFNLEPETGECKKGMCPRQTFSFCLWKLAGWVRDARFVLENLRLKGGHVNHFINL